MGMGNADEGIHRRSGHLILSASQWQYTPRDNTLTRVLRPYCIRYQHTVQIQAYHLLHHHPCQGMHFSALFYNPWWHTLHLVRFSHGDIMLRDSLPMVLHSEILYSVNTWIVRYLTCGAHICHCHTLQRTHSSLCH